MGQRECCQPARIQIASFVRVNIVDTVRALNPEIIEYLIDYIIFIPFVSKLANLSCGDGRRKSSGGCCFLDEGT